MAIIKGISSVAAFKKATVWGTPVVLGALDGVGFVSESIAADVQLIEDQQLEGSSQQRQGEAGNRLFAGDLVTGARYEGLEPMVAQVFGTAGVPTTVDTTARVHTFKLNSDRTGIFGTFAIDKGFEVHEFTTAKLTGLSIKCAQGERAEITFRMAAQDMNINTSAGTNNNTTMGSVTQPANREYLQFKHMVIRANAQGGAGLGASDVKYVSDFSCDIDRADKVDDITTQYGNRIDEPEHDSWTMSKLSLGFSKYSDAATGGNAVLFAAQLAKTAQKIDVIFTGETLAGAATEKFSWKFFFNSVQPMSGAPNVSGPGLTPFTLDCMAYRVTAAPTGFPAGFVDAVTLQVTSQHTANPLA